MTKDVIMNDKTRTIVKLAEQNLGNPYIFSAIGQEKNGVRAFDCRGFTYWLLKQVGIEISTVGATTQYNTKSDWVEQGKYNNYDDMLELGFFDYIVTEQECDIYEYKSTCI